MHHFYDKDNIIALLFHQGINEDRTLLEKGKLRKGREKESDVQGRLRKGKEEKR